MLRPWVYCSLLVLTSRSSPAQSLPSEAPATQAMLAEIRQLRSDLQTAAITIQRVNIVIFRLQAQSSVLDRLTQKVDQVREQCEQAQTNQKMFAAQLEASEADRGGIKDPASPRIFEQSVADLKSALAGLAAEVPRCQAEQAEAESQLRSEQNKMSDLQDQLEKLDKALAAYVGK
jgi:chromosome segregation ATPase